MLRLNKSKTGEIERLFNLVEPSAVSAAPSISRDFASAAAPVVRPEATVHLTLSL